MEQGRANPNAQAALLINLVERYPDTSQKARHNLVATIPGISPW